MTDLRAIWKYTVLVAVLVFIGGCEAGTEQGEESAESISQEGSPGQVESTAGQPEQEPESSGVPTQRLDAAPAPDGTRGPAMPEGALGEWPPIEITPEVNDFGQLAPFTDATANFTIRNVGSSTQQIVFVRPTCPCLTFPNLMGVVIEADQSITVPVTIAGREAVGPYRAALQLRFNGYTKILRMTMQGEVLMPIVYEPLMVDARSGESNLSGAIRVSSQNGEPFSVLSANGQPPEFADGFNPEVDSPRNNYAIQYDLASVPCDEMRRWWVIETDHRQAPLLPVFVRHPCTNWPSPQGRTWSLDKLMSSTGIIAPGHNKMVKVATKRIGDNTITDVTTDSTDISVRLLATREAPNDANEDELIVLIMPRPGLQGPFYARLEFRTATEAEQFVVIGTVRE